MYREYNPAQPLPEVTLSSMALVTDPTGAIIGLIEPEGAYSGSPVH